MSLSQSETSARHCLEIRVAESPVVFINGEPQRPMWLRLGDLTDDEVEMLREVVRRHGCRKIFLDGEMMAL